MIVSLARRRPQKVALEAATLARLAPGRFILGVGMGMPVDFTRFGEDDGWRVRADKIETSLALLRRLWAGEDVGGPDAPVRFFEEPLPPIPVWVSGEWPRRQPFHGASLADGVFPIVPSGDDRLFAPPAVDILRDCLASLPDRARRDCALWSFGDRGDVSLDEYEAAGVTWWMGDTSGLAYDEVVSLVAAGPPR